MARYTTQHKLITLSTYSIIVIVITWWCCHFTKVDILHLNDVKVSSYTDRDEKGNSVCTVVKNQDHSITYRYTIKEGATYPNAGLLLSTQSRFDASSFSHVVIEVLHPKTGRFHFFYNIEVQGKILKYRAEIETNPHQSTYDLILDQFKVPSWYIKNQKIETKLLSGANRKAITCFSLSHDLRVPQNEEDQIDIASIMFYHSNTNVYLIGAILWGVGIGAMFLFFSYTSPKEIKYIPVENTTITTPASEISQLEIEQITAFIAAHYHEAELSLRMMRKALKIPENKISTLIKSEYKMSYKEYVNGIRIAQAKKLLSSTEDSIGNIAFACGFGSLTSFNRLFKEHTNSTPTMFRDESTN